MDAETLTCKFTSYFMFKPYPQIVQFRVNLEPRHQLKKGSIIDIETTGLDPSVADIITIGVLRGNTATIHQLTTPAYPQFKSYATKRAARAPTPRYGYNIRFESDFLGIQDGWHDLTQYAERTWGCDEWGSPYYRMQLTQCTFSVFKEPNIIGADVPRVWQEWLKTKKPQTLSQISLHCLADLLRTRQLINT